MKYESLIRGSLRKAYRQAKEPSIRLTLSESPIEKGPRGGAMFICNHCGLCFSRKEVQVDHIEPVIPIDREVKDWNEYISRLFCGIENLQVLCKECHQIKTNREREERNEI